MQEYKAKNDASDFDFYISHNIDNKIKVISIHQHDFYEVYYYISGNVEYNVEGHNYHMEKGDMLLINPLELHQAVAKPDQNMYERIVLWINKSYISSIGTPEFSLTRCFDNTKYNYSNLIRLSISEQNYISSIFKKIFKEVEEENYGNEILIKTLVTRFLVEINRLSLKQEEQNEKLECVTEPSPLIASVLEYINSHYCEKLTLSEISDKFFVNKYYLSHKFNTTVGSSLYRYITLKRLINAKQMLSSGIKPTIVAVNCGFNDYAGFYRAFKSEYNITPTQFAMKNKY